MIDTDDLLGCDWVEGGRDPETGMDCLGVVLVVLERAGIDARDPWDDLAERWRAGELTIAEGMPAAWVEVDGQHQVGDVAEMSDGQHVAAYLGDGWWCSSRKSTGFYRFDSQRAQRRIGHVYRRSAA